MFIFEKLVSDKNIIVSVCGDGWQSLMSTIYTFTENRRPNIYIFVFLQLPLETTLDASTCDDFTTCCM